MHKHVGNRAPSGKKLYSMTMYLNIAETDLKEKSGYWTAKEIAQQPEAWGKVADMLDGQRTELLEWLQPILKDASSRIILTGAGTSAYVGEALAPYLTKELGKPVEAISTTEMVSNPDQYLLRNRPTLIVSYARSGNSPESVGAVKLADQLVDQCYHLIITCNKDSKLASSAGHGGKNYCLFMPEETLDQSFAMTSSFSSMMLATLCVFAPDNEQLANAIEATNCLLDTALEQVSEQAEKPFRRIAFLGCGGLLGIATEAKLKMLELSTGKIDCYAESPLGFRHGPKFILDKDTMVVMLNSANAYRKKYDDDLLSELVRDRQTDHIYALNDLPFLVNAHLKDAWLALPYIVYCQALAFYKSLSLDITPDNPCPSGEVNRVVQGVSIYPYEG